MSGARVHCCAAQLKLDQLRAEIADYRRQVDLEYRDRLKTEQAAREAAERYAKHCEAQLLRLRVELVEKRSA